MVSKKSLSMMEKVLMELLRTPWVVKAVRLRPKK